MPIPSDNLLHHEWAARTDTPRHSVFENYRPEQAFCPGETELPNLAVQTDAAQGEAVSTGVARAFIYRLLAAAYEDPTLDGWAWLCGRDTQESLSAAVHAVVPSGLPALTFEPGGFDAFHSAYLAAFGHAARGSCPLNEIEYGDIKADPLFQPHRLADLAAFYRAYGLEVAADAGERQDHLCLELEFMCVLAAKEAYAVEQGHSSEQIEQCRDAQRKFIREHLGRWTPAFARRLAAATREPALQALAEFTRAFVESECARLGVVAGSEELLLRAVDETVESMCGSCGLNNALPGA